MSNKPTESFVDRVLFFRDDSPDRYSPIQLPHLKVKVLTASDLPAEHFGSRYTVYETEDRGESFVWDGPGRGYRKLIQLG